MKTVIVEGWTEGDAVHVSIKWSFDVKKQLLNKSLKYQQNTDQTIQTSIICMIMIKAIMEWIS